MNQIMTPHFLIIIVFLLNMKIISMDPFTGDHLNFFSCFNNQTIAVQVLTQKTENKSSCQCQAGLTQESSKRDDYVYTPAIGSHKLHTNAKTWNEARKVCNEEGGHLAIINTKAEEGALVSMLINANRIIRGALNTEEAYLGIHDIYGEGEWVTVFGEPLDFIGYKKWSKTYWGGQPDNYGGNQNCGALLNKGAMDDVNCNDKFAFFCELPTTC